MPAVCVSRSKIVIARRAGVIVRPLSARLATPVRAKDGIQRETGLLSAICPSSTSIITATLVSALVWEAIRKIASGVIARRASRSDQPTARS